ncbi:MAG TPA: methyl-accepting chemotaxis protein [Burkholderiales bacterium]|nr:methyl-accepting chemotaxis protein [Burkholderiales bacterium]
MSWLTGSIRNKLIALFALGLAIVFAAALYGFAAAWNALEAVSRVNDTLVAQAIQSQALQASFKEQVQSWLGVLVRGHDAEALDKSWKQFEYREREVRRLGEKLQEAVELPAAKEILGQFLRAHAAMGARYRDGLAAFKASDFDARKVEGELRGIDAKPTELIEETVDLMREEARAAFSRARTAATQRLTASLVAIAAVTLAALFACSLLLVRTVVRPLAKAVRVTERVAEGDLRVEVGATAGDETGRLLQGLARMRDGLAGAVAVIRQSAQSVGQGSREIADGHADLSSRTEQQASSLEETAASMEELATTLRQNTDNARQAQQLAQGASQQATEGGKVMAEAVGRMSGVFDASRKIADIIGVIDGIAFQTNILALNAAVEAARAGEQGRGFAVVASEVRALAQRVAAAAKEIKGLIQNSVDEVGAGTKLVEAAGRKMDEIVQSVRRVTDVMSEIAAASTEQLSGVEQVSRAVTQMDQVVQQNASLVAETSAATERMATQTEQLVAAVAKFRLDADEAGPPAGSSAQLEAPAPRPRLAARRLQPSQGA